MNDLSPKVPQEVDLPKLIPFFSKQSFSHLLRKGIGKSPAANCSPKRISADEKLSCHCPHVLVADDDPFQLLYYEVLLQKPMYLNEIAGDKKCRYILFSSGEELLEAYKEMRNCGCTSLKLIITDYLMGKEKLNGVTTAASIRELGYRGIMLLRTSESTEDLCKNPIFKACLESKRINKVLNKANYQETSDIIRELLQPSLQEGSTIKPSICFCFFF